MKIPARYHSIPSLIDAHHESKLEQLRPHLGCSQLGHPCDRWIWLRFRWAVIPKIAGRIARLFRRGHLEETTIVDDLRSINLDIRNTTGRNQVRVDFGSHVSGSIDAIIESGVPEAPRKRHIAEFKTHNAKSFAQLEKHGVQASKPEHYVQMQLYMHGTQIDRALYLAVCKNDDALYTERVRYDKEFAEKHVTRGQRIALSNRMPEPIGNDPDWYQCKMCDGRDFCYKDKLTKESNCRTCAQSTPLEDGTWHCDLYQQAIPVKFQSQGCESHVLHPDLVPWQRKDGLDQWTAIYVIDGHDTANGHPDANVYSSKELIANAQACSDGDDFVKDLRIKMDAKITK